MKAPITYSLTPIKRVLHKRDILHLLRRAFWGITNHELELFAGKTIDDSLKLILNASPTAPPPIQEDSDVQDPIVAKGKAWINAPYENDLIDNRRGLMLKMWWAGKLINRDCSLTEKMTLFWHNHFVTEMDIVKDSRYSYQYISLIRNHALGNFKKLVRDGTTNIAMLVYLNGNTNEKGNPNENFARELMELFTLGKGVDSKYTEDDVRAAARVLSGWKDNKEKIQSEFFPSLHDTGDKLFSAFFDNSLINGRKGMDGISEIDELIEMIFKKKETAKFVCRNIYRWFVSAHIDDNVEQNIIKPLAEIFIASHYEIIPVIKTLLSSEHFFDETFRGCLVKNPVDFLIGSITQLEVVSTSGLKENHIPWLQFYFYLGDLSMDIGNPPSVAGWAAYYQPPKFHQWWINSASLGLRTKLMKGLCSSEGLIFNGPYIKFDFVYFIHQFKNPRNVNSLVDDCLDLMFAVQIENNTKRKLKGILLSGQENEKYWEDAWDRLIASPNDAEIKSVIQNRLRLFFEMILALPEYQLM